MKCEKCPLMNTVALPGHSFYIKCPFDTKFEWRSVCKKLEGNKREIIKKKIDHLLFASSPLTPGRIALIMLFILKGFENE